MKTILCILLTVLSYFLSAAATDTGEDPRHLKIIATIPELLTILDEEVLTIHNHYENDVQKKYTRLNELESALSISKNIEDKLDILLAREKLKSELTKLKMAASSDISKVRYIKGLQIIKILYDKTLALDHHFASVSTLSEINKMSNPNQYPEFAKIKSVISSKQEKKAGFNITSLLGNNIYTSIIHSFVSMFNSPNATKEEKETNLQEIECILDFTLRMHNDLNTIYFETTFLQKSNESIMKDLQQLFVDYTKPINYSTPLKECRNTDDWDGVSSKLNHYLEVLDNASLDESQKYRAHKMAINLEFPIDRLLQFITQYNAFIDQGGKFYEKFGIMLHSYENEEQCSSKIPQEYQTLKTGIAVSIEKFNTAYKPVEINGSKMKQVIYGLSEFD